MFRAEEVRESVSQKHMHMSNHFQWHHFPIKQNPSVNEDLSRSRKLLTDFGGQVQVSSR